MTTTKPREPGSDIPETKDPMRKWFAQATAEQRAKLAEMSGVSLSFLYQVSNPKRKQKFSAGTAGSVAEATQDIFAADKTAPQPLTRGDLCKDCSRCGFFLADTKDADDLK